MKKLFLAALILISSTAYAGSDELNKYAPPEPYDKVAHVVISAGMTYGAYYYLHEKMGVNSVTSRIIASTATFMSTGLGKELYDKNFDMQDMAASGAGVALGLGFTFEF